MPCKKRASTALAVADQEDQAAGNSDGDEAWVLAAGASGAAGQQSGPSTTAANLDDDDEVCLKLSCRLFRSDVMYG